MHLATSFQQILKMLSKFQTFLFLINSLDVRAVVLGKFSVPNNLDYSRERAYRGFSRCGWGGLDIFSLVYHFSLISSSLWKTARYRPKYYHKGRLNPEEPTNRLIYLQGFIFTVVYNLKT